MTAVEQKPAKRLGIVVMVLSGLLVSMLLLTPTLRPTVEAFARHKPGLWGQPTWYLVLLFFYGVMVLAISIHVVLFALGLTGATYKRHALLLIGLTLVRGLLYSSITPPWQSPDEHAHFEYAALLGQLKRVPTMDDLSPELQEQITRSMFNYDFWRLIKRQPVDSPPVGLLPQHGITEDPPTHVIDNRFLYYPQVGKDPPLYYPAPGMMYLVFPRSDTALQLYAMRLTTVLMLLALIIAVIWAARRLFHKDVLLAMGVSTLVAFHPMLAHMGSVLNNDILAAVWTTTLLGVLVLISESGLDWWRGLTLVALSLLGLLTKQSTVWTLPLIVVAGLIYGSRTIAWMRYGIIAIGVVGLALLVSLFIPSRQARYWEPASFSWGATVTRTVSHDGARALRVAGGSSESGMLGQHLLSQYALDLRGHTVSLAAQVRTDSGEHQGWLSMAAPDRGASSEAAFTASPEWQRATLQFLVPEETTRLQVILAAAPESVIYFDQVTITDVSATDAQVEWLRNNSGEQVRTLGEIAAVGFGRWLGLSNPVQRFFSLWQLNLQELLADAWPIQLGFESFWGNFGAALAVPLPAFAYQALGFVCGIGAVGIGIYVCKAIYGRMNVYPIHQQYALLVLGMALLFASFTVFMPLLAMYGLWAPQGRYLFPIILPIGVFLTLGWSQLVPNGHRRWLPTVVVVGMAALDCTALSVLTNYFYGI
jgi:hypothetical protein